MNKPFRIDPNMPASAYKTFQIAAPKSTHWRQASCQEFECVNYMHGWKTILPVGHDLLEVVRHSGRSYTEVRDETLVTFTFAAGQECFQSSEHKIRTEAPELFIVRDGDYRGNPRGTTPRVHTRPEYWVEDFAGHQQSLADTIDKG